MPFVRGNYLITHILFYFRLKKMGIFSSMNIFLRQEIDRMQAVIVLVRNTLTDLLLAIEGTIIMSEVSLTASIIYNIWLLYKTDRENMQTRHC